MKGKKGTKRTDPSLANLTGITYLLLLTGDACQSILEWSDLSSETEMMNVLTAELSHPKIIDPENYSDGKDTVKIGTTVIYRPSIDDWTVATSTAKFLSPIISELSLGMKTKLYQKIVANKAFTAVNELKIRKDRIDCSAKILDVVQQNPSVQQAVLLQKSRKKLFNSLLYALSKQSTKSPAASEKEAAGLKKKKNSDSRAGPNSNSTSNNNNNKKQEE